MPLHLARAFDLWILFSAIGFFLTILYHPHKRWWANVNARNWIVETEGASVGFRGANSEWGTLETFLANWVCSEPAIQAPGFGQCPGCRKVSTTTFIHDEVVKYMRFGIGKCQRQRLFTMKSASMRLQSAKGWPEGGAQLQKPQKKTCDTTILSSEVASMLKVKFKWMTLKCKTWHVVVHRPQVALDPRSWYASVSCFRW